MKKTVINKIAKEVTSILLLPMMLLGIVLLFSCREDFVTYDVVKKTQKEIAESSVNVSVQETKHEKSSLMLLPEDIYSIECEGERICVYNSQNEKVYTAKASLSDFPENDRLVLENKITHLSLNELLEIMEYIES